jgi:integrase
VLYLDKFLEKHPQLSFKTLEQTLWDISTFAKKDKVYKTLICFAKFLINQECLEASFLEKAKTLQPMPDKTPSRPIVTEHELKSILKACETRLDKLLVLLIYCTGIRASEACTLHRRHIRLRDGILTIIDGKGGKDRVLGISYRLDKALRRYLRSLPKDERKGYLLKARDGNGMTRYGLRSRLARIGKSAKVKLNAHILRRAFVTHNEHKGIPLSVLQDACGHSSIETTRAYCRTDAKTLIKTMRLL